MKILFIFSMVLFLVGDAKKNIMLAQEVGKCHINQILSHIGYSDILIEDGSRCQVLAELGDEYLCQCRFSVAPCVSRFVRMLTNAENLGIKPNLEIRELRSQFGFSYGMTIRYRVEESNLHSGPKFSQISYADDRLDLKSTRRMCEIGNLTPAKFKEEITKEGVREQNQAIEACKQLISADADYLSYYQEAWTLCKRKLPAEMIFPQGFKGFRLTLENCKFLNKDQEEREKLPKVWEKCKSEFPSAID